MFDFGWPAAGLVEIPAAMTATTAMTRTLVAVKGF